MSMRDLLVGLSIVAAHEHLGFFVGPRDAKLVWAAERAFGGTLPATYREFVTHLGAGNFGGFEVYGVIDGEFEHSTVPNGVWLTLNERRVSGLPNALAIIGSTGYGDYYCVDLAREYESPVLLYRPGLPPDLQKREQVAEDFGKFFLDRVRAEI
jgi:hypothetical protein